jgi:hypothetical protein
MRPVETIPEIGGGEMKENNGRGVNSTVTIIRTFVDVTVYLQYNNNKNKFKKDKRKNTLKSVKSRNFDYPIFFQTLFFLSYILYYFPLDCFHSFFSFQLQCQVNYLSSARFFPK